MVKIPGARPAFKLVGNPSCKKELGLQDAEVKTTADSSSLLQKVGIDFSFAIPVQAKRLINETVVRRAKQGASCHVKDMMFQNLASRNYRVLQLC